jgi:hypothetical protein
MGARDIEEIPPHGEKTVPFDEKKDDSADVRVVHPDTFDDAFEKEEHLGHTYASPHAQLTPGPASRRRAPTSPSPRRSSQP